MADQPSIVCPRCGTRSFHPQDIAEKYCGRCHNWHELMPESRWPNFCGSCAALLEGGTTKHRPGCEILAIIEEVFRH
jgi:ribosomal protein L37E